MHLATLLAIMNLALFSSPVDISTWISGRITLSSEASTFPDVDVSLFSIKPESRSLMRVELVAKAKTDQHGQYRFAGLTPGSYMVRAEQLDCIPQEVWNIRVARGGATVDIELALGAHGDPYTPPQISGIVTRAGNAPLEDATVTLVRCDNAAERLQARSDKNGHYSFSWLLEGQYALQVSKPDFRSVTKLVHLEKETKLDFRLRRWE